MVVGTPGYMAPEQARGDAPTSTRAPTSSALGCVLYRCLAGRVAFPGETAVAVLAKILFDEVPPVLESRSRRARTTSTCSWRACWRRIACARAPRDADRGRRGARANRRDARRAHAGAGDDPSDRGADRTNERRLVSVILVAAPSDDERLEPDDDARHGPGARSRAHGRSGARRALRRIGARAERLADGTLVLTLSGQGSATDQAAHAARCALARARAPAPRRRWRSRPVTGSSGLACRSARPSIARLGCSPGARAQTASPSTT